MTERPPLLEDGDTIESRAIDVPDERNAIQSQDTQQTTRNSGCFSPQIVLGGCALGCGLPVLLALATVAFLIFTGINTIDGIADGIRGIFQPQPARAEVVTSRTLVSSIKPLGQLVSISVELAKADIRVEVRDGFNNACGRTAFHVAQGTIEAGIDLTRVTEADVSRDLISGAYTVTLPPPQLTSCRIDYLNQYERSTSACGPSWENIRLLANYVALTEFRDDSIEGGILEQAREQAEVSLSSFLQLATGQNVTFEFAEADDMDPPPSCQPDTPATWLYDPDTDMWSN